MTESSYPSNTARESWCRLWARPNLPLKRLLRPKRTGNNRSPQTCSLPLWRVRSILVRLFLVRRLSVLRNFLALIENLGIGAETLIVFVLHDFLDVHIFQLEVQLVVRFGVDGKPVLAVDLLPPGGELGKEILLVAMFLPNVGDGLAIGLHNLEIVIVDPDAPLEVALLAFDLFGRDVEDVAIQFVFLLLSRVEDVVVRQVFGSQHERQAMPDILDR